MPRPGVSIPDRRSSGPGAPPLRPRQEGALSTRGIKLEDGFNPAYLDPFKSFLKEIGGPDLPGLGQ